MKVRIQSKSGDLNSLFDAKQSTLVTVLEYLRSVGGYLTQSNRGKEIAVPFEEIKYIEAA